MKAAQDILFSGQAYRNFVCSAKSIATKTSYTKALRHYMKFKNLTSCEQLLEGEPKLIQSSIIDWVIHLKEEQNLASASISMYCAALRHFYNMNDIVGLNWKKINSFIGESIKTVRDRPYTRDGIGKLLEAAPDRRLKIAILLMCSSGLRIGAISELKLANLERISKYEIYHNSISKHKTRIYHILHARMCVSNRCLFGIQKEKRRPPNAF